MIEVINGTSEEVLKTFPDNHFHSCVTDPPWAISFMSKHWDYDLPSVSFWKELLRVLKPGAFILVCCGTRTQHRMAVNIEDGGFEIRDIITHHYGSGFPKSLDVSKAIDKHFGAEREVVATSNNGSGANLTKLNNHGKGDTGIGYMDGSGKTFDITAPATDEAKQWDGWGTALKPATEFWTLARKPLIGTVAENVLEHGTGGLNIDGCRVPTNPEVDDMLRSVERKPRETQTWEEGSGFKNETNSLTGVRADGRFPANVIFDEFTGQLLDAQSGTLQSGMMKKGTVRQNSENPGKNCCGWYNPDEVENDTYGDSGGASRFFYCAKASKSERNEGLQQFEAKQRDLSREHGQAGTDNPFNRGAVQTVNHHPTVKPISLMQYLVRLITPPNGIILDPFAGSCTTGIAAKLEGFNAVLIEREKEYCEIGRARIEAWKPDNQLDLFS